MRSYFFFIFSGFLQENDDENEIEFNKYIELIDDFYRKDSKDKITNVNFFDFYIFYQNNLKEYFFKNVNSNIVKTKLIKIKDIRKVYYIYQKEERDKNKEMADGCSSFPLPSDEYTGDAGRICRNIGRHSGGKISFDFCPAGKTGRQRHPPGKPPVSGKLAGICRPGD